MDIGSNYLQSLYSSTTMSLNNSGNNNVKTGDDDDKKSSSAAAGVRADSVNISQAAIDKMNEAKGSRVPQAQEIDFENMSDEDLVSFAKQMQQVTGNNVPGLSEDADLDNLSTEEISQLRSSLSEMAANGPQGGGGMGGAGGARGAAPASSTQAVEEEDDDDDDDDDEKTIMGMTEDEFKEYLEKQLAEKGAVPGMKEGTSVSELSESDLEQIRSAMMSMGSA